MVGEYAQIGNDINIEQATTGISGVTINDSGSIIAYSREGEKEVYVHQYNSGTNTWDQLGSTVETSNDTDALDCYLSWQRKRLFVSSTDNVDIFKYSDSNSDWELESTITLSNQDIDSIVASKDGSTILFFNSSSKKLNVANRGIGWYMVEVDGVFEFRATLGGNLSRSFLGDGANHYMGNNIDISDDGKIIAIGSEGADDNGTDTGKVQVYRYNETTDSLDELGDAFTGIYTGDKMKASSLNHNGYIIAVGRPGIDNNSIGDVRYMNGMVPHGI